MCSEGDEVVPTNHVAMVSHPDDVVKLIESAAEAMAISHQADGYSHDQQSGREVAETSPLPMRSAAVAQTRNKT